MSVAINFSTLLFATENRLLKEYADFLYLKHIYSNSCFYNYSHKSLSEKSGFSRSKIKRLVHIFTKHEWCTLHSGNLVFNNLNKGLKRIVITCDNKNPKSILIALHFTLIQNKERQQKFIAKKKLDLTKPDKLDSYKSALRYERKHGLPGERVDNFNISLKKLAQYFCISTSAMAKILNTLKKEKLISVIKNIKVIFRGVTEKMFQHIKEKRAKYCFFSKGLVIEVSPSTIIVGAVIR